MDTRERSDIRFHCIAIHGQRLVATLGEKRGPLLAQPQQLRRQKQLRIATTSVIEELPEDLFPRRARETLLQ